MKRAIFTLFALILTGTAFGWGTVGHKVVIAIAQRHLTEKTKANIAKYIDYDLKKDAVWMDKHRNDEPIAYTTHYHVFAADKNLRYDPNYRLAEGGDVVYALAISEYNLAEQNYKQLTDSAVVFNLRMIIHFMGDMHCPVHIDFPQSRPMWYMVNGVRTRFHKMWDGAVISNKHKGCSPIQLAEEFDIYTDEQIAQIQQGTPMDWHNENIVGARRAMEMVPADGVLTDEYFDEAVVIAEERLTYAGYRLAAILNAIFDK